MTPERWAEIRRKAGIVFAVIVALAAFAMFSNTPATDCSRISEKAASGRIADSDVRLYNADC